MPVKIGNWSSIYFELPKKMDISYSNKLGRKPGIK
jgi:hypothetical protein